MAQTDNEDYYRFTGGRWLWAEEARLLERYKKFSVPGLKHLAAEAVGARSCVSIFKLAEGGFNKIFRLSMDNGSVVIARIPNPNVGPAFKVMASEVATMDFARNVIGIPVPKVLAWDGGKSNSVESEYVLMEEAKGTQLEMIWSDMDLDEKFKVVDDVVAIQQKLQSVAFSRFGHCKYRPECSANDTIQLREPLSDQMHRKAAPMSKFMVTCPRQPGRLQEISL
ncbi:Phosphotransferase enzyme [Vermiconidia calcicola]|uniref:Phosphotransferase enzyme n=1 Tax=Vermiconidia calcicola TaxID=1690605 RepID=A0ACC3N6E2_9PEZI|nr:Phosphotransferase enzyme [Vermiconidia calcicola]